MFEPMYANYTRDGDDWTIEVAGKGKTLTDTAPGLIAARDRADQLAEKIAPNEDARTVVHTLDGDALDFTAAYLAARLGKPEETPTKQAADEVSPPAATA
ncbi:MAG: hypothetical protein M3548_12780 [Actinomycetota bacterium]|nr:hypothetical protein [Actinomycetota bacterium]